MKVLKSAKKAPIVAQLKQKMGLYFHTINHTIQVFLKFSFLAFVDAPVMCILILWYFGGHFNLFLKVLLISFGIAVRPKNVQYRLITMIL